MLLNASTVQCIADMLEPVVETILYSGGIDYPTEDMTAGIDLDKMCMQTRLIKRAIDLDSRGAHFLQREFMDGLRVHVSKPQYRAFAVATALEKGWTDGDPFEGWLSNNSLAARTLFSHFRIKATRALKKKKMENSYLQLVIQKSFMSYTTCCPKST